MNMIYNKTITICNLIRIVVPSLIYNNRLIRQSLMTETLNKFE